LAIMAMAADQTIHIIGGGLAGGDGRRTGYFA
jgi:hypothetical protein